MIRIICPKCKNAYLDKKGSVLTCPDCAESFDEKEENLFAGTQYYNECDYDKANDCLMKYIVQNGAEPKAIFYKALCDGFCYDEDTVTLSDTYNKILESLKEIPVEFFPQYLALANDETEKLEKAVAHSHINSFVDADAEKIKKEVSTIINLQNEAKAFRIKLNALANEYNDKDVAKISVKFSECFLVEPELATQVGNLKFDKIAENIASHTVFTGILSTDIKNLEIYYRCIVMFFKKNRQKYDFLMASAEKFTELSKLLEEGQYSTIKGTSAIGDKLKSAGYDFFQESLKDHDEEFQTQTETVVIIETEEPEAEEVAELEDVSSVSTPEKSTEEVTELEDISSVSTPEEVTEEVDFEDIESQTVASDVTETEKFENDTQPQTDLADSVEEDNVVIDVLESEEADIQPESTETEPAGDVAVIEVEETTSEEFAEKVTAEETVVENEMITEIQAEVIDDSKISDDVQTPVKRKKSIAPFVPVILIVAGIIAIICLTIVPKALNKKNYTQAEQLMQDGKYQEAAEVFAKLGDYEDAQTKEKAAKYNYAASLEKAGKYEEAKVIYEELGTYEDSMAKYSSCTYNIALNTLNSGKYDEAKAIFQSIPDYLDSKDMVFECDYQKGNSFIAAKSYDEAIKIFTELADYSDSKDKILEAKYKYVKDNLSKDNATTLEYIEDLIEARYLDIVAIRRDLLGTEGVTLPAENIATCINYAKDDFTENLTEVDKSKQIYYHITVTDEALYNKKVTVRFTTSVGYTESKTVTFTETANTYSLVYPRTDIPNYTVEFKVISDDVTLTSQTVTIK